MGLLKFLRISMGISPRSLLKSNLSYELPFSSFPVHKKFDNEAGIICNLVSKIATSRNLNSVLNSDNLSNDLSPKLVHEVLKKLNNAGAMALSFFRWAEKQKGFQHTPECYNALIDSLGKIRQFKTAWRLVDEMQSKGILCTDTFALISRRLVRARKVEHAVAAFENMEKNHGLKPELQDYNRLLDILSKSKHVEIAHQVFDVWKNTRFTPDVKSYAALIEGWGQERNFDRLNDVCREMRSRGLEPDVVTYGILINAYCKAQKLDDAVVLYKEMEAKGMKATPHVYCTLIYALGSEGKLDEAIEYFDLCRNGCGIEVPMYNALVGAYCKSGRVGDAYGLVDEMRACRVGPDVRTYEIILHHLVKAGRGDEACGVFERMGDESVVGVTTYEIMMRMFCNEGQVDMAVEVWDQMKKKGVLPGMQMYLVLINSLCDGGKLAEVCTYVQEMMDMGMCPPGRVFSKLKKMLVDAGEDDVVIVLANRIEKLRNTPLLD